MKTLIISIGLLGLFLFSTLGINAQEAQEKSKEKDQLKKQQIIEKKKQQKELDSITEKAEASYEDELKQLIEQQKKAQAESKDLNDDEINLSRGDRRVYRVNDIPRVRVYDQSIPYFTVSGDNTTFTISKRLKDVYTFSSDFEYEVPENVTGLSFTFGSELESGNLKLTITKPGGKVFQVFTVAPIANVDWNKKFKIKDGESKDYSGSWKITISTKEAKGYYELKINSY